MEEFIEDFKAEAGSIIDNLQSLLLSYQDSSEKLQMSDEVFRGVHTLKGTAKMFGFNSIESVTHTLENILDEHRKKSIPFTPDLTEIILSTLDFCLCALEKKESKDAMQQILGAIEGYSIDEGSGIPAPTNVYCILLKPDADIFQRGVNVAGALSELKGMGDVLTFNQEEEAIIDQQIKNMALETPFDIWIATTQSQQDVEDVFMFFKAHEFFIIQVNDEAALTSAFDRISEVSASALSAEDKMSRENFLMTFLTKDNVSKTSESHAATEEKGKPVVQEESTTKLNYLNVPLAKLDQMMNLVSEFVTLTGEVKFYASLLDSDALQSVAERLEKVSTSFRDNAFNLRLVPIQILGVKLQRYVKDLSEKLGKKVRFITEGMDTEIDKSIINQIEGPLMHIIRNAIDHGIESPAERISKGKSEEGILKLSAFHSGTNVFIHIQDDGAGIHHGKVKAKAIEKGLIGPNATLTKAEAINLIFRPGFTTANATTEISGRGVGMDVVQKNIQGLRGSIEVTTEEELGTSFAIRLPLALSVMDVMIVKVGDLNYMIPNSEVHFCTAACFTEQVQRKGHNLKYKDDLIPFIELRTAFNESTGNETTSSILILEKNDHFVAIEVDEIIGKDQVVIKPIDETLQVIPYLAGTSILGDGQLAFLINVLKLKELYACEK